MTVTRAQLSQCGIDLVDLAASVDGYATAVRKQVTAITTNVDAVGAAWSGPIPTAVMERAKHWVSAVYEAPNTIGTISPILRSWAQSAWTYSDMLPDRTHNDPDAETERREVAGMWKRACASWSGDLETAISQLECFNDAEVGGPFHGMFEMFEGFGDFFGGGFSALGDLFTSMADIAVPTSWGAWMAGQQPRQEDMDLAQISNDVYDAEGWNDPNRVIGNGYHRVPEDQLPPGLDKGDFENTSFGNDMRAALYTDGNGHYVLAFAGTDSVSDALTDVYQGVGLDTRQYEQGRSLAESLKAEYGDNLVMTGHSLGGGVASYAALATDSPAVTFNAAGLSDANMEGVGLDWQAGRQQVAESGQVRAYHVESDVLTNTQEEFDDIPDAVGTPITIANPIEQPSDWLWVLPPTAAVAQGAHAVDMHLMDSVLAGMEHSDLTFSTNYQVDHGNGNVETRSMPQTYEGGWFDN